MRVSSSNFPKLSFIENHSLGDRVLFKVSKREADIVSRNKVESEMR